MVDISLAMVINLVGIGLMLYCLYNVIQLRSAVTGGVLKKKLDFLFFLIIFFTAGYFVPPFLTYLPEDLRPLLVAGFSIFGAIYVLISVKLIDQIIQALSE